VNLLVSIVFPVYTRLSTVGHQRPPTEDFPHLDKKNCRWQHGFVIDVAVIEDPGAAEVSLNPMRSRLLAELAEPGTATSLAGKLGVPRQNLNYHLKALERHGLVELVEERKKGNMTERVLRATALSYVISPAALDGVQPDPSRAPDRLSARWLIAVTARAVRDVGQLVAGATKARKRLATFAMDGEVRFATAADRAAFAEELAVAVTSLVSKYHDETAPRGRDHRVIVAVHPSLKDDQPETTAPEGEEH